MLAEAGIRGTRTDVTASVDSVPDDAGALVISTTGRAAAASIFGRPAHDKQGATSVDSSGRRSPASAEVSVTAGKP